MKRLNVRLLLALVLLLILLPTLALRAYAETEPNGTPAEAQLIIVGYQNAEINAQITPSSDDDYYKFVACAGCTYVIETFNVEKLAAAGSTGLYLYGTDGTTLLAKDDGSDGAQRGGTGHVDGRIVHTFFAQGIYYIEVTSQPTTSWAGYYSLRVLPKYDVAGAGWDQNDDDEPNDVWEISNSFSADIGNAQTHQIYPLNGSVVTHAADRDWYRFTAFGGTQYYIETFDVVNVGIYGAGLQLYGADKDTPLKEGQRVTSSSGRVWKRIIYSVPAGAGGEYFVRVAPDANSSWTGQYSLRACQGPCESSSGRVYVPLILKSPAPPPEVIFYDDFSDPSSGWPIGSSDVCDVDYDDGKYRVEVKKYKERCIIPGYPVPPTPNGTFSTIVRRTSPKERGLMYGFFFGAGSDPTRDRWALEVRPDRVDCDDEWAPFFWLSYLVHGKGQNWNKCMDKGINTGDGKWNELKVIRNGRNVKVYINDHKKMEKDKSVLLDDGFFYLEVISLYEDTSWVKPVVVEFDEFKVLRSTSP
jgi:hypothetical protein